MAEEKICGYFKKTIYKSSTYMVTVFSCEYGNVIVTGTAFDYDPDAKYTLCGEFIEHPKYGSQFQMSSIFHYLPSRREEIVSFLASSSFKGIGRKAAEKIYETLGDNCLSLMITQPESIESIALSDKQKTSLLEGLKDFGESDDDLLFQLISLGFSGTEGQMIIAHYGEQTVFILQDNPFLFYLDLPYISFQKALNAAKHLDFPDSLRKFKQTYLIYLFKDTSFKQGDVFLYENEFFNEYLKRYDDPDEILKDCVDLGYLVKEEDRVYLSSDFHDEKFIANDLIRRNLNNGPSDERLEDMISQNENEFGIKYDDIQKKAIRNFFENDISVVTGGPGTGKTTIIKAVVSLYHEINPFGNIVVAAPTGRAAKRISEICEVDSKTLHSLLRWNPEDNSFVFNDDNPILYDALIIDEFSMVDNNLFSALLKAGTYLKKIMIIGDGDQLPSIRQGNLLKDLIDSDLFHTTRLNVNHRQTEGSEIISLSQMIVERNLAFSSFCHDIQFLDLRDYSMASLISSISNDLEKGYDIRDIQVLSPMYKGEYGIDNLNYFLQSSFNPQEKDKKEKRFGNRIFREQDKVLQLKNRPNDDVYNGDIGTLEEINELQEYLLVDFQGIEVFYRFEEVQELTLAYALSVHKSQGSEYQKVYFLISKAQSRMLYNQLIYTAVSRAKQQLVIVAEGDVLTLGITKSAPPRKTTLKDRLLSYDL